MKSKRDWHTISTSLQLGEISAEEMPRLLFDCIHDLNKSQSDYSSMVCDIKSVIACLDQRANQ